MNMAYTYRIDPERRMGFVTLTGRVDGGQLREAMAELYGHPDWQPGYSALWEARAVDSIAIAPEDLPSISETLVGLQDRVGPGRGAWVVRGEMAQSLGVLLARRAQQQGHERRSFTDPQEALRWLAEAEPDRTA